MKQMLFIFIAAAILVSLPLAGRMDLSSHEEPARLTIIEKNMTSPTLQELGQKVGNPSRAQAPVEPLFFGERKAQWI